jgi:rod shape-determining protein MreD
MFVEKHPLLFYFTVTVSIILALFFSIFPKPTVLSVLQPELVCLFVIYWVFSVPQHLGLSFAVIVGLIQDLVEQSIWGGHSIALAVTAYICLTSYQRFISYGVWHQSLWVFVLVGVHQILASWVKGLLGYQTPVFILILPVIVTALLWPVLTLMMRSLRRKLGVS